MAELKEVLKAKKKKKKKKKGKQPEKVNLNYELYKHAGDSFHERMLLFLNNIFTMGEMPEEWKNSIITPKCGKQKWRTTEELADLTHAIDYIVKF